MDNMNNTANMNNTDNTDNTDNGADSMEIMSELMAKLDFENNIYESEKAYEGATEYLSGIEAKIRIAEYAFPPTTALILTGSCDGFDDGDRDDLDDFASVNIVFLEKGVFAVDENNWSGIGEFLKTNGIAEPMNHKIRSGYCEYPIYALTPDFIRSLKPIPVNAV